MNDKGRSSTKKHNQFYSLLQSVEGIVWEAEMDDLHFTFVSEYAKLLLGYSPEEWLAQDDFWENHIHPDDKDNVVRYYREQSLKTNSFTFEYRMIKVDGELVWIKDHVSVIRKRVKGRLLRGMMVDITQTRQTSALEHLEKEILELNAKNETPLKVVLFSYLKGVEMLFPKMKATILQVKNNRLYDWASPSLPAAYIHAIENLPIGENAGSCGAAVFLKQNVIVSDIANDPRWKEYKHLALPYKLRACWSYPIIDSTGDVMAVLGMYNEKVRLPADEECKFIERVTALLRIILENRQKTEMILEANLMIMQSQELAGFGNWRWDVQNNIVTWSKTLYGIYGLNEKEFKATFEGYQELLHPEDRERVYSIISNVLKTKIDVEFEERIIRPDGEMRYLKSWGKLKSDPNGLPIEMIGACLDITQSRKTQEALKASESRLKALSDTQTNYVVRVTPNGKYIYINKKYKEDFDWILNDKNITDTFASVTVQPYHHELVKTIRKRCFETPNHVFQVEFDNIQQDGGRKHTLWHFIGLMGETGKVAEIQCIGLDITDLKNTEQALKISNQRYEYASMATNDALFDWDIITGHVKWGSGFFKSFGFNINEDYNFDKWAIQVHPSDLETTQNSLMNAISNPAQSHWAGKYRFKKAYGTYAHVEGDGYIVRDDDGNGIRMIGVLRDISERLDYLNAIEQQNKKLLDIAWIHSHDLRAPLAKIMGLVDLIISPANEDTDKGKTLEYLLSSAHELDRTIKVITEKVEHAGLEENTRQKNTDL